MIENLNSIPETDLHISTHICENELPAMIRPVLSMAQAFQLIRGTEKPAIPSVKPLDQKQILLSLLPEEFESKRLVAEAQMQGIPQSTIMRWCSQWIETGLVCRLSYGHYKKLA